MKDFAGRLLFIAFVCLAFLIAINFKEIKNGYLEGRNHVLSRHLK